MNAYDRTQKIDDYLENNMSKEEKKEFERLLPDPSASLGGSMNLNEEVKMQKAIIQEIQRRALRSTLMDENRRYRARQRIIPKIIALSSSISATAIAAVILIMFMVAPAKDYIQSVSSKYAQNYHIDGMRGNTTIEKAKDAVASKNWEIAEEYLKEVGQNLPYNPESIENDLYDTWVEYHWLKALCEMHNGHVFRAKYHLRKMINEEDDSQSMEIDVDDYIKTAKELLKEIKSKQRKLIRQ